MSKKAFEICTMFAGPSLQEVDRQLLCGDHLVLRPPVTRGDIDQLIKYSEPSNIAIVDGVFHSHPAVGHAEILEALRAGWRIWGLSSMGAIRACEMDTLGMIGFGEVYRQFASDQEMSDDEVTLIHQAQPPFLSLSEPLIHIRHLLTNLSSKGLITKTQEQEIVIYLKNMWYGHRTLNRLRDALLAHSIPKKIIEVAMRNFSDHRIKNLDLKNFLISQPWMKTGNYNDASRNTQ